MDPLRMLVTCRVCLASDREMYRLANTALEETYEQVTSETLTVEGWPCCVCGVCLTTLRRCRRFIDTAREANDALNRWFQNQTKDSFKLVERPLFFFTQTPTQLFEMTSQGIQDLEIKHETVITENEDNQIIHQKNKINLDDEGTNPRVEIKFEAQSPDENDTPISDNIESHNSQVLSDSEYINAYDDMINIEKKTTLNEVKDISKDRIKCETVPSSSNCLNNQALLVVDIPFRSLESGKRVRLNEDTKNIRSEAESAMETLLPAKSKEKYMKIYKNFMSWKNEKKANNFSETVFLAYFNEIAKTKKPSTLWAIYSMLKCTVHIKNGIDLEKYGNLITFLKRKATGFKSKKSKTFTDENIRQFLIKAPDDKYLAKKVAMILGVNGACRSIELYNITTRDIEYLDDKAIITLRDTETKIDRMFMVRGELLTIVKKYHSLRPTNTKSDRFFLNFQKGKCTKQVIGRHKIAKIPKEIATYLNLKNPESYTGHCFRRSSAGLADSGANSKRHGGWKSDKVTERYIEDPVEDKTDINITKNQNIILQTNAETESLSAQPSTSKKHIQPFPTIEVQQTNINVDR